MPSSIVLKHSPTTFDRAGNDRVMLVGDFLAENRNTLNLMGQRALARALTS
jgi:hypothetical protein